VASLDEARQAAWRADIPLVVLAHGRKLPYPDANDEVVTRLEAVQLQMQRELAGRSSKGRLVVAEQSGHVIQSDRPDLVMEAIRSVVEEVRQKPAP
jgi:hypothetical protein